ncbi:MAG: hypothetical protein MH252_05300 [Thermosynechococcaceae cyanobacterium MS004]|nr:hypothetical protein [Thermosynechococcaceae cyanobacterium MS004]
MKSTIVGLAFLLPGILATACATTHAQGSIFSGRVNRVWEDGLRLNSGNRSITVDTYGICGDNTARQIAVGEQVTVTGEFDGGEFDAFSITRAKGESVCR